MIAQLVILVLLAVVYGLLRLARSLNRHVLQLLDQVEAAEARADALQETLADRGDCRSCPDRLVAELSSLRAHVRSGRRLVSLPKVAEVAHAAGR